MLTACSGSMSSTTTSPSTPGSPSDGLRYRKPIELSRSPPSPEVYSISTGAVIAISFDWMCRKRVQKVPCEPVGADSARASR